MREHITKVWVQNHRFDVVIGSIFPKYYITYSCLFQEKSSEPLFKKANRDLIFVQVSVPFSS